MRYVPCNLCGADDFAVLFPKGLAQLHRIVQCNRCGLMYANPQELIDCERLATDGPAIDFNELENSQYYQKQKVQLPDNLQALRVLDTLRPKKGSLLEIGSYCGFFLSRVRADGWETTGLEPEARVAAYAREKLGLEMMDGTLPRPAIPDGSFDAVVALHVIEHMPDPKRDLEEIHRLLKPGGVLVLETPRFDSLMFKLFGRRERSICNCNGHIFFFTVRTLRRLLEQNGFRVFRTDLVGRTLTLDRVAYNIGLMTRSDAMKRWLSKLSQVLGLARLKLHLNVRDMQRVYAEAT